jgi:HKD family nuclease
MSKKSIESALKISKSPSKTSTGRGLKDKQEGGKLQPINRPKMLKKLSERYEKGEVVIVDLIKALMHEICPLYEV